MDRNSSIQQQFTQQILIQIFSQFMGKTRTLFYHLVRRKTQQSHFPTAEAEQSNHR
jgi:hypothetical protein